MSTICRSVKASSLGTMICKNKSRSFYKIINVLTRLYNNNISIVD